MKHLSNKKQFIERMWILKDFEKHLCGIMVCSVLQEFIKDLVNDGFNIPQIVNIINFLLYEYDINFKLRYHHVYHYVKKHILKK